MKITSLNLHGNFYQLDKKAHPRQIIGRMEKIGFIKRTGKSAY